MTYSDTGSRRLKRAYATRAAKRFAQHMTIRSNDGGRPAMASPHVAVKVIERGTKQLFLRGGGPFAMQLTQREAAAFIDHAEAAGRYAMAFGLDRQCRPYCSLPVCAFPLPGRPVPTELELVEAAEQAALSVLYNEALGFWPHMIAHTVRGAQA